MRIFFTFAVLVLVLTCFQVNSEDHLLLHARSKRQLGIGSGRSSLGLNLNYNGGGLGAAVGGTYGIGPVGAAGAQLSGLGGGIDRFIGTRDANERPKMTTNPIAHYDDYDTIKNQRCEVKDDYDHENVEIEYVIENVLFERQEQQQKQPSSDTVEYENLSDAFNSVLLNSCSCTTTMVNMSTSASGVTVGACGTYATCPHGGNYISSCNELVLNPDRHSHDLIYECSVSCKCDPGLCDNRLVQFGPRLDLEIIASKLLHKQYALQTNAPIPRGAFVCEYAGEILTRTEAQRRMKDHDHQHVDDDEKLEGGAAREGGGEGMSISEPKDCNKMNYVLCLNEYSLDGENASSSTSSTSSSAASVAAASSLQQTFVDPRLRGNIGRYLNHSCHPNCEILSVRVDCPIPKIAIFAKRDIDAGEELCFHYGDGVGVGGVHPSKFNANAKSIPCHCGSDNCENFLPNLEF